MHLTFLPLRAQTARFLLKTAEAARQGGTLTGITGYLAPLTKQDYSPGLPQGLIKDIASLSDLTILETLFAARACSAVATASARVNSYLKRGIDYNEAFNSCAITLVTTATVHCYYFMVSCFYNCKTGTAGPGLYVQYSCRLFLPHQLKTFIDTLRHVTDTSVRTVLKDVCVFFALSEILDGQLWAGILSGAEMSLVQEGVAAQLTKLRPQMVTLVDSFDFSDRVLGSDLGGYDGNVYEALYRSATNSTLNFQQPFQGYVEFLQPHLDREFLQLRNALVPEAQSKL